LRSKTFWKKNPEVQTLVRFSLAIVGDAELIVGTAAPGKFYAQPFRSRSSLPIAWPPSEKLDLSACDRLKLYVPT